MCACGWVVHACAVINGDIKYNILGKFLPNERKPQLCVVMSLPVHTLNINHALLMIIYYSGFNFSPKVNTN